ALETVFVGAHRAVIGVVEPRLESERLRPWVALALDAADRLETPPDLARQNPAIEVAQFVADEMLGAAGAVEWRSIKIADAGLIGVADHRPAVRVRERGHSAADRRAAKAKHSDLERRF